MSTGSTRGILFRGATGKLWLLVQDGATPQPVPQDIAHSVNKSLDQFALDHTADFIVSRLPDDVINALNKAFDIALNNVHFCNAPNVQF